MSENEDIKQTFTQGVANGISQSETYEAILSETGALK